MIKKNYYYVFLLIVLLLLCVFSYFPALKGGFIFDDFYSLQLLQHVNGELNYENLKKYFAYSDTGVLKRPVSVFSFLIDAQNWPASPTPFKITNLIIHMLNGVLLFLLIKIISAYKSTQGNKVGLIAFFSAAFWLLHPFLLSTSMYIVQRMAMLPVTFILLGLILYVKGRFLYGGEKRRISLFLLIIAVFFMTGLSVLSKENGVLLLAFIALTEYLIIKQHLGLVALESKHKWFLIYIPLLLVVIAVLMQTPNYLAAYETREFTVYERLLSESRALFKYLFHLFNPHYLTEGVFTDGFKKSIGLFQPVTTIFSIVGLFALIIFAIFLRKNEPVISFGILFFFIAHILESTYIPLELYFEHRNYSAFLFIPFSIVTFLTMNIKNKQLVYFLLASCLVFTCFQTYLRAQLWGNNFVMHQQTMSKFPESKRARIVTASFIDYWDSPEMAISIIEEGFKLDEDIVYKAYWLNLKCENGLLEDGDVEFFVSSLKDASINKEFIEPLGSFVSNLFEYKCGVDKRYEFLRRIISALEYALKNQQKIGKGLLYYSKGRIYFEEGHLDESVKSFLHSFKIERNYQIHLKTIAVFLQEGFPEHALKLIEYAQTEYKRDFKYKFDWFEIKDELDRFNEVAKEDIKSKR